MWVHLPWAKGGLVTTISRFSNAGFLSAGVPEGFQAFRSPKTHRRNWRGLSSLVKSTHSAESLKALSVTWMGVAKAWRQILIGIESEPERHGARPIPWIEGDV